MHAIDFSAADYVWTLLLPLVALVALLLAFASVKIAKEYERGVVFRLGRLIPLKGPGLFFIIPSGSIA